MSIEQSLVVKISGDVADLKSKLSMTENSIKHLKKEAGDAEGKISNLGKVGSNVAGMISAKAKDNGLSGFIGDVTDGTSALSSFAGPAAIATGAIVGIGSAAIATGKTLFDMANAASDYSGGISDASQKTGLAIDTISSIKFAGDAFGASFEEMTGATTKFTKLVGEAAKGSDEASKTLKALGVDPKKAVNDLDGALSQAMKRIYELPPGTQQANAAIAAFGKSGANLIPVLNAFEGDLGALKKRAKELGLVLTDDAIKAGDDFGDMLAVVTAQLKAQSAAVALEWTPEITGGMGTVSKYLADNKDDWKQWGRDVGDIIRGVRNVVESELVTKSLSGIAWFGREINKYNPSYWAMDAVKKSGAESRLGEYNAALANSEMAMPGMLDNSIGYAPPSAKKGPGEVDGNFLKNLGSAKKDKKKSEINLSVTDILNAMRAGTAEQETNGRKDHLSVQNTRTGATGTWQVLPKNIPDWTEKTFGVAMTVDQFKKNAQAQVAVFNKYMGAYLKKGLAQAGGNWEEGVRRAAAAWYGGEDNMKDFDANFGGKGKEPTFRQYTKSVLAKTKKRLGDKSGYAEPLLDGPIEEKPHKGKDALASYVKEYQLLGATTEKARVEFELMSGVYDDLSESEKDYFRNVAVTRDMIEQSAKGRADYNSYIEKLTGSYDDLFGVQKTATAEFEDQLAAAKASGVWIDAQAESYARMMANLVDLDAEEKKQAEAQAKAQEEAAARLQKLDGVVSDFGLTIKAFAKPTELDRFYKAVADPDITKAIEERAKALGMTADALKKMMENAAIDKVIGGEIDYNSTGPRYINQGLTAKGKGLDKGMGEDFSESFFGSSRLGKMQSDADVMKSTITDLGAITAETFDNMAGAVGSAVEGWALYGDSIGEALQKATAAELAHVAGVATVNAIYATALGFMRLAEWDLAAAGNAFISAGIWAAVAGGTALGAKAIAGDSSKKDKKGSSNDSTQNPSEYFSNSSDDRSMNYLRQSQNSSSGFQQVSSRLEERMGELTDSVKELKGHIGSVTPGDVLTNAIKQRPGLVTETVNKELGKNSTTASTMGRRLGLK